MKALREAAAKGDLDKVKKLHEEEKANLDEAGPMSQNTALHHAALNGHVNVVNYLVEHVKNVDPLNLQKNSPLSLVIQNKKISLSSRLMIIKTLLEKKANPLLSNELGRTPLMYFVTLRDSKEAVSSYYFIQEVNLIIRQMKQYVLEQAQDKSSSVSIRPDGSVVFGSSNQILNNPNNFLGNIKITAFMKK